MADLYMKFLVRKNYRRGKPRDILHVFVWGDTQTEMHRHFQIAYMILTQCPISILDSPQPLSSDTAPEVLPELGAYQHRALCSLSAAYPPCQ